MSIRNVLLSSMICTLLLSAILFSACSNPEAEAKIAELGAKNAELSAEIQVLQKKLDSMKVQSDSMYKVLQKLDMAN
ncbi:MAG: hypothetical protein MJY99_03595 [Fibrobacter sp.]|uniref:hypothetical protein n=1 Tax=Fibrobacter sp. TaxID=35828 RepID=UPI00388F680A|nr:hypothetical protein [Fibrobacter sp.]